MPDSLQSPIDIAAPMTRDDLPPLDFRYPAAVAATAELVVHCGDPIDGRPRAIVQVVVTPPRGAAELRLDGVAYELTVPALAHACRARHRRPAPRRWSCTSSTPAPMAASSSSACSTPRAPPTPPSPPSSTASPPSATLPPSPCPPSTSPACCPRPAVAPPTATRVPSPPPTTTASSATARSGSSCARPVAAAPAQLDAHRALVDAPLSGLDRHNPPGQRARSPAPRRARDPQRRLTPLTNRRRSRPTSGPTRPTARRRPRAR